MQPPRDSEPPWRWLLLAAAFAAFLRLSGAGYGLPNIFNSDEPHLVNLAVSFGSGNLEPQSFKYPTLWPTILFAAYGGYFLAWSGFGLARSLSEFSALFAWEPTGFYMIGRLLAGACSLAGAAVVWRMEREHYSSVQEERFVPWGALLLAFAPVMVEQAHAAKPDCLMFLVACAAWLLALRVFRAGERSDHWLCGAAIGLALTTQYTAAPCAVLLPLAHFLGRPPRAPLRWLGEGVAASLAAFFIGSPYILLRWSKFLVSMSDFAELGRIGDSWAGEVPLSVLLNLWNFAGEGSLAGLAVLWGGVVLFRADFRLGLMMVLPIVAQAAVLSRHPDGLWLRYLAAAFPGLAFLASRGLSGWLKAARPSRALGAFLAGGVLLPGMVLSTFYVRGLGLPDTRTLAESWVASRIPPGATVLMDYPHTSPRVRQEKAQLEELAAKTAAAGSPRSRLYRAMASSHPGGGWRVLRLSRTAADLRSNPRQVAQSQADAAMLDVSRGLSAAREAGVRYVITSSFGADPDRATELGTFFRELHGQGELIGEFFPSPGRVAGPGLRVFLLPPPISYTHGRLK